ncbi:hypothetical protein SLE2022_188550 [Rubroshorea leprosula]
MADGEQNPPANLAPRPITVMVKSQDGSEVYFRIKPQTQFHKLMNQYCLKTSLDVNSVTFLFDGRRLRPEETPEKVAMEDGDEIDCLLHQVGGGGEDF